MKKLLLSVIDLRQLLAAAEGEQRGDCACIILTLSETSKPSEIVSLETFRGAGESYERRIKYVQPVA